ncbi:MAG: MCE family protein [Flavobacteriaceae bacterium]|nr:MCE family protein [Flavobacteriaceae bacterium]
MTISKEVKIGFSSLVILVLFVWGLNFLKGSNLFGKDARTFYVRYHDVKGLGTSSKVTINGLVVGRVLDISFDSSPNNRGDLVVEFRVDSDFTFSNKSLIKIYDESIMGGKALSIIPSYDGEDAVKGDFLEGTVQLSMLSTMSDKLTPMSDQIQNLLLKLNATLDGLNSTVFNERAKKNMQNILDDMSSSAGYLKETMSAINNKMKPEGDLDKIIKNTAIVSEKMVVIASDIENAKIADLSLKMRKTLDNTNTLLESIASGKGTLGKLMTDDAMYNNLKNASKELEEMLRDMKLHPKRYVHFSLFAKKEKPYVAEPSK